MKRHAGFVSFLLALFLVSFFLLSSLIPGSQQTLASRGAANAAGPVSYSPFANTFSLSLNPNGSFMAQYMRINAGGGAGVLNITSSITAEAWIKPNAGDGVTARAIVSRYQDAATTPAQGGYYLRLNPANKLKFSVYQNAPGGVGKTITGNTTLTSNQWYHVVGIYDGVSKQLRIYLNGISDASPVSSSTGSSTTSNSFRVGASNNGTEYFNGLIDEVRVTAGVVYSANFSPQPSLGVSTGCKGLWNFDNADGADTSGSNNPGNFFNSPGFSTDVPSVGAPPNQPPVANAGGPYSGTPGTAVQFNGTGSSDPDGSITNYNWNFGDGGTATGASPTHAYATVGTYNVTLIVTDNRGATSASSATTATITNTPQPNQPPVANPGGPYSGIVGNSVSFNGTASSDPDGSVVSYDWDFGDGTAHGAGANPAHTYALAGTYTVTLRVTDNRGTQSSPVSTTANITSSAPTGFNLALNRPADQSSTVTFGVVPSANLAVDGNTSGDFSNGVGSVTHTNQESQPWWRVDLGSSQTIQRIDVWNRTDCCSDRLSNFYVFVSNVEFTSATAEATVAQMQATGGATYFRSAQAGSPTTFTIGRTGRYVRVQLQSSSGILSLAEVQVWGNTAPPPPPPLGDNMALNRPAVQSSTATFGVISYASLATDGNTNGSFAGGVGSVSHTYQESQPWWRVDLGSSQTIQRIDVWNRTDCCSDRLSNFYVFVSNVEFSSASVDGTIAQMQATGGASYFMAAQAGSPTSFTIGRTGRYVRVQLVSTSGILSLAEVQVWRTAAPPPPTGDNFSKARIDPVNRIGSSGEDLFSGNFNWGLPVLSLPGRAGLNLIPAIVYNSLVWTKDGSSIKFDADNGYPAPGFRLGFPVIQAQKYISESGALAYLMILPSGHRVELRRVGSTSFYEAADSSYLQLDESTMIVRMTDGTRLSYSIGASSLELECREVKDRNGNYITINYNGADRLATITDTLARSISFLYDGNNNLQFINQTWNGSTHTWATFSYTSRSIVTNFQPSLTRVAPSSFQALTQVTLDDGSRFNFDYTSYGQVKRISNYAADNHLLNYVAYNLPESTGAQQADCPRFSERRDFAQNWIGGGEAVTSFIINPGSSSGQATTPDNTTTVVETFSTTGWRKGLTAQLQIFAPGLVKTTTVTWAHDGGESALYKANPRVVDNRVTDDQGNVRRTATAYTSFTLPGGATCSLPSDVTEYNAGGFTPLRRTHTDYSLDANYLNRRIIGLPSRVSLFDGSGNLFSKMEYGYDWGIVNAAAVTNHDAAYHSGFVVGRANLSGVGRWNLDAPFDSNQIIWTTNGYDINGSLVHMRDAAGHGPDISYADSFSAGNPALTLAYPTRITDPDGFFSTLQYHYDIGLQTRRQDPKGAVVTTTYDGAGRVSRVDVSNGSYTRFDYPTSLIEVRAYTSIDVGVEAYVAQALDGAGRVIGMARNHPGSASGFNGQKMIYDVRGRLVQQSNPTEIFYFPGQAVSSWTPAGDDAATGWAYTSQQYDWNNRETVTTNVDNTTRRIDYSGCGCAGGSVVTVTDEVNRRQKSYHDILGRLIKTEILNSDLSVYSTTTNTYDVRNQITEISEQQGTGGPIQRTTMTYDGHKRLGSRKLPVQSVPTTYAYNVDDTIQRVTDARGATTNYSYNNRRLVTGITYGVPAGVAATAPVSFGYDAAGNRTSMSDGAGSVTYVYDTWSRLTSETRQFIGVPRAHALTYTYNLAGGLKSITDPFNATINYSYDQAGRMSGVTGSPYGGVTQYATGIKYRAWGGLKQLNYGNTRSLSLSYNARLQVASFNIPAVISKTYEYYEDGMVRYSRDLIDGRFDRLNVYDHAGRVQQARSGAEARGEPATNNRPYKQTIQYDAFNHIVSRTSNHWSAASTSSYTYANDRNSLWDYDANGNVLRLSTNNSTFNTEIRYTMDAADRPGRVISDSDTTIIYDGDGQRVKAVETAFIEPNFVTTSTYHLISSVLNGRVISEVEPTGNKKRSFVYFGESVLATQWVQFGSSQVVEWEHRDASGVSFRVTNQAGQVVSFGGGSAFIESDPAELDPFGTNAQTIDPYDLITPPAEDPGTSLIPYPSFGSSKVGGVSYTLDGIPISAEFAQSLIGSNSVAMTTGPTTQWNPTLNRFEFFTAFADGFAGFLPGGSRYLGNGRFLAPPGPGYPDGAPGRINAGFNNMMASLQSVPATQAASNDCLKFAEVVHGISRSFNLHLLREDDLTNGVQKFMDRLAVRFTELPGASYFDAAKVAVLDEPNERFNAREFGSSGFASAYYEPDWVTDDGQRFPNNQVRHAVGGLLAGYVRGESTGLRQMNGREDPNDPLHGVPDINLNNKTVAMGARIAAKDGRYAASSLWMWIRDTLCAPQTNR